MKSFILSILIFSSHRDASDVGVFHIWRVLISPVSTSILLTLPICKSPTLSWLILSSLLWETPLTLASLRSDVYWYNLYVRLFYWRDLYESLVYYRDLYFVVSERQLWHWRLLDLTCIRITCINFYSMGMTYMQVSYIIVTYILSSPRDASDVGVSYMWQVFI